MISDKVVVADKENECEGMDTALAMVKKTAEFVGFTGEAVENLSLLAQEMIVGSAAMLDVFSGIMWAETDEQTFMVKLEMKGTFTQEERERLIALTRDNKNTLPKGFFAKLGVLIGDAMSGEYFYPYDMAGEPNNAELLWESAEIAQMMEALDRQSPDDKALGEKAKEILDTLSDDITVAARSGEVLITVKKALPKAS